MRPARSACRRSTRGSLLTLRPCRLDVVNDRRKHEAMPAAMIRSDDGRAFATVFVRLGTRPPRDLMGRFVRHVGMAALPVRLRHHFIELRRRLGMLI